MGLGNDVDYWVAMKPDWNIRCNYCGEVVLENEQCCSEIHNELQAECPLCHEEADLQRADCCGVETYVYRCVSCNWVSDPE